MELDVSAELARLRAMGVSQLRERYAELFGEATNNRHREWLIRRIIWRLQAMSEGDLSERARQRATELANDADLRVLAPRAKRVQRAAASAAIKTDRRLPPPGSLLVRPYKGQQLQVEVRQRDFLYLGQAYPSLSAVAKAITGSHCNGFLFFRLTGEQS